MTFFDFLFKMVIYDPFGAFKCYNGSYVNTL